MRARMRREFTYYVRSILSGCVQSMPNAKATTRCIVFNFQTSNLLQVLKNLVASVGLRLLERAIMSSSASEKDLRSLDEDSGHDSIDDAYSSPAEDRERIEHLETVVSWIRQEVVSQSFIIWKKKNICI